MHGEQTELRSRSNSALAASTDWALNITRSLSETLPRAGKPTLAIGGIGQSWLTSRGFRLAGEMAAGLSHELSQPLTAIIAYARSCLRLLADRWLSLRCC